LHCTSAPRGGPHEAYVGWRLMGPVALSLCLTLGLPLPSGLLTRLLPLASEILCTESLFRDLEFYEAKCIEKFTIYKPQCNFLRPLHRFPQKRIIGQVLMSSINSLHEHIILRNTNRLLMYVSMSPLNINHTRIVNCGSHILNSR
jgi:hypothetical protein